MTRMRGSISTVSLFVIAGMCLSAGPAAAQDIAWDLVASTSQNLLSYTTDAPVFTAPGYGFQNYDYDVNPTAIPYSLIDDTAGSFPADLIGIIDATTDHDEFFGVTDTVNNDNPAPGVAYHATWVFDISSAAVAPSLAVDLAAMGNFEIGEDVYTWSYQVDGGQVIDFLTNTVGAGATITYTMADGTTRQEGDPLIVNGTTIDNQFTTFTTTIPMGSTVTVVLTAVSDGGTEGYVARNIRVFTAAADTIFADNFEGGTTGAWSVAVP